MSSSNIFRSPHATDRIRGNKTTTILLGIKITDVTVEELQEIFSRWQNDTRGHSVVTVNPEMLVAATHDRQLWTALGQADLAVADGFGIILASWLYRQPIRNRITGVDLAERLLHQAAKLLWPVYLLGAQQGVAERAASNLAARIPGLKIVGAKDGGLIPSDGPTAASIIDDIRNRQPAVLLVALGHGKQERFIANHLRELPTVKIAMGVGGTFDYWAGVARRAPKFMRQVGLEWLYRLIGQPQRLPRILNAIFVFPYLVLTHVRIHGDRQN